MSVGRRSRTFRALLPLFAGAVLLFGGAMPQALAQLLQGSISGNVSDASQAAVASAKVSATDENTGLTRSTAANSTGIYDIPVLPPGTYKLTVSASGFQTAVRTGVVVVTYNSAEVIEKCLDSCNGLPVVVVDNASRDTTQDLVRKHNVRLIANAKNRGFGGAANQGVAELDTELILLLNPDVELAASIEPLEDACLRIGFGMPQTGELLAAGIPVGLSVDTVELTGNADMFGIMKLVQNIENGKAENEFKLTARRVLELGTIEGARSMGIDDKVGSLKPGKRADLIMVSTRDINLGVFTDPAHMLVTAAQPGNVDTVVIDGRILKRGGKLAALNVSQVVGEASAANAALRKRAEWW